jgi:NADH dehydrogenase/NADH:ubiquinone oxidoreductase subunit G
MLARCPDSEELRTIAGTLGVDVSHPESLGLVGDYLLSLPRRTEETKCIRCGLCVRVCAEVPQRHAISFSGRGLKRRVVSPFAKVADSCIGCGSCAYVCPTKTITIEPAT